MVAARHIHTAVASVVEVEVHNHQVPDTELLQPVAGTHGDRLCRSHVQSPVKAHSCEIATGVDMGLLHHIADLAPVLVQEVGCSRHTDAH